MSVYDCPNCCDTGEDLSSFCTCTKGRNMAQQERAPVWPGSALVDAATNNHRDRMVAEHKEECWNCERWYISDDVTKHICKHCSEDMDYPHKLAMGLVK